MKILSLRAENFKRLSAVEINPDGSLVVISGRNGAGKSSVLDAIWAALGGKAAEPDRPIRRGQTKASVSLDLGDLQVTRTWDAESDRSTLVVRQRSTLAGGEFVRITSPQSVLDKLFSATTFEAMGFIRMRGDEQARTLRDLTGLDLSGLDREREAAYSRRTEVNRQGKDLAARVKADPSFSADLPAEEIVLAELIAQRKQATGTIRANEAKRRAHIAAIERLEELRMEETRLEQALADCRAAQRPAQADVDDLGNEMAELVDPDVDAIEAQIESAEQTNTQIRQRRECAKRAELLAGLREASVRLTRDIEEIDAAKAKRLAETPMPVPGLTFDGAGVYLNGIPFSQASSAEQLQCSLAIGAALNPTLRVIRFQDGSLLDADGMRRVAEWAAANDCQVWLERVAGDQPIGVVIEDGAVVQQTEALFA